MLQNIGFSLAIITVLIPLAIAGVLGLATVVFIHELAEVFVIANAVRATRGVPALAPPGTPDLSARPVWVFPVRADHQPASAATATDASAVAAAGPDASGCADGCCTTAPISITTPARKDRG
jgi:hypothetical protein